ncbi:MAG: glycosyltransferase family 39 protein [Saprospiraceae bacterium]|nr:glycosyltransferase family 39 protein [Saprospiraceae bacterium]
MKPSRHYTHLFAILCLLLWLGGCKKAELHFGIKNHSEITLTGENTLYLCSDRNSNNQLICNRKSIGEWEKFFIHFLQNGKVTLQASDHSYVAVADDREGYLFAGYPESENNVVFKIIASSSGGIILQDYKDNYVGLDTNNNALKADKVNRANAAIFSLQEFPAKKFSHFSFNQLLPLIFGLILLFVSLVTFQYQEKKSLSILLLLLGGFSVRLFMGLLNPHLNLWDEQFHALVAKNMIDHPLSPMLYKNPVLSYDETSWVTGHVWLHKQPLFLWQMALSMKFFGANVFALRLPSLIMSTLVILFIYRIGELSLSKKAGFFGALLFALSNFVLEISSGAIHTDHNDIAFLFYVTASIWAWTEYESSKLPRKRHFLILIGLFSGCAILVKWLTGFLVFSGWGLSILLSKERRVEWVLYRDFLAGIIVAAFVFLPWQIYILHTFPTVSQYEFALNAKHLFNVIEGHGGDFWWHFDVTKEIYGVNFLLLLVSIYIFFISLNNWVFKTAFVSYIVAIYLFFGFVATKMIAFTFCVSFLLYLAFGATVEKFLKIIILNPEYLSKKIHKVIYTTLVLGILSGFNLDIEKIQENHTAWKKDSNSLLIKRLSTTPDIQNLAEKFGVTSDHVVFNCAPDDNIPVMFFNEITAAYGHIPDFNTYLDLKQKGHKIAIFDHGELPSHLMTDKDVIKIPSYWTGR